MTSKEYIKGVIYNLEDILENAKRDNCKPIILEYEDEIEHYYQILKDLEELEQYRNEKYKHWNIFFNGAKLEYLLYLEKKGKESFMTSISEELFSKIMEHFL